MSYRILLLIDSTVTNLMRPMRKYGLAVLLISPICLCVSIIGYNFIYSTLGRITDFNPFSDDYVQFPDTNYVMNVTKRLGKFGDTVFEINLQNIENHNGFQLVLGTIGGTPEYSSFQSEGKTYLLIKTPSLGNDGAMKFQIYSLNGDKVKQWVGTSSTGEPTIYSSCVYPRLYQNELYFEDTFHCDFYPLLVEEQFFYSVKLSH